VRINADFSERVLVHGARLEWVPSPMPGVDRRMLDRIGDEVARATSIVRYSPGSSFSPHVHGGGEEFLVLAGVFQDELGDYPVGSYVRNPPTSRHTPRSEDGCTIFVKLQQFHPNDRTLVRLDAAKMESFADAERPGVRVTPLFADAHERVRIEAFAPCAEVLLSDEGGYELLVLSGTVDVLGHSSHGRVRGGTMFEAESWLRLPPGDHVSLVAGAEGARVWSKAGHLAVLAKTPLKPAAP
jgi:anti-sigma factor ChrR (cupin superfamily)